MGVVIITTLVFGLITPPYGLSLLVASKFVGVTFGERDAALAAALRRVLRDDRLRRAVPDVVLWLPKQFLPESVGCFKAPAGSGYICPP